MLYMPGCRWASHGQNRGLVSIDLPACSKAGTHVCTVLVGYVLNTCSAALFWHGSRGLCVKAAVLCL